MTSINALRLSRDSGLMICDEARYWNPEWMIFYTPEKIRSVTRTDILMEQDTVMFMGQTGTSSIGDEWIQEIRRRISEMYDQATEAAGGTPGTFLTLRQMADEAFDVITRIKHEHINDFISSKFGFGANAVIQGKYTSGKESITISDRQILERARKYMDFQGSPEAVKGIFGNSQILAGYTPSDGFRIFYMTERWPVCEEIHEIFIAQGSGRDTCDLEYARFADTRYLSERRGDMVIPRAVGLFSLLKGLDTAMNQTAGIGGYPKIIYIDGTRQDRDQWVLEISDKRSKLAQEMVSAAVRGFVREENVVDLLEKLIFKGDDFQRINGLFVESAPEPRGLFRFLRKYPLHQ